MQPCLLDLCYVGSLLCDVGEKLPERKSLINMLIASISRCVVIQLSEEMHNSPRATECLGMHAMR